MRLLSWLAATCVMIGLAAPASGAIVYRHDFVGQTIPLHGAAPDVDNYLAGGNAWTTRTDDGTATGTGIVFYDDGAILGTDATANGTWGNATLPLVPENGKIYTLDVSLGGVSVPANSANWVAVGFTQGRTTTGTTNADRFIGPGGSIANPWMLYRGTGAPANQLDQTFTGPGTAGGENWPTPVTASRGDAVDLRIVLDTTGAAWQANWYAKNPSDAAYTSLRSHTFVANPTIAAVGYAIANNNVTGTIRSFQLSVVPEPASLGLAVMALTGIACAAGRGKRRSSAAV